MPLLSVVITVYNLESYIEECLDSVLAQNTNDYEIVLVDNGSTDNSKAICAAYAKKYKQINFINLIGEGIWGRAHQVGFAEAKGKYVHMLDGDDYVVGNCYADIMEIIRNKRPDVIFGSFQCCQEEGAKHLVDTAIAGERINNCNYHTALNYLMTLSNFHMPHWRFIFCKNAYFMENEIDEALFSELFQSTARGDEIRSTRILIKASTMYYYDKPFYIYRTRAQGGVTSTVTPKHFQDYLSAVFGLIKLLAVLDLDDMRKKFIYSRIITLFRLFTAGIDMFNHAEISALAGIIEKNKQLCSYFEKILQSDIKEFSFFIKQYNTYVAVFLYCAYKRSSILSKFRGQEKKNIYIFPTGNYGEMNARILKNANINICGFIDNDIKKDGISIMDLPCMLPSSLRNFSKDYFENILVVISTAYERLNPIFKGQLLDIGLSEEQIVIKE